MKKVVVLKFGGTSVSTRERWETIRTVIQAQVKEGEAPFIICSAISGVTNLLERLLEQAVEGNHQGTLDQIRSRHQELCDELGVELSLIETELEDLRRLALGASLTNEVSPRLRARALGMGELMLTRLGAAFLSRSLTCEWVDARQHLRAITTLNEPEARHFLSATCDYSPDTALQAHVQNAEASAFITQGFIAQHATRDGEFVLLGRGGSDTSGAYFAHKLEAERLEIWTDVPGMYTANPREVASARLLKRLHYEEAQELASMGAKVLHPRCLAPVREAGIPLYIKCTQMPEVEGTIISGDSPDFGAQVKAISSKGGVMLVSMDTLGMWQQVGFLADAFQCFKQHGLSIDLVTTSESNVTVSLDPAANVLDPVTREALMGDLNRICSARMIGPCAAVSLVGHNIRAILHQLGPALEAFGEQRIYLVSQAASDLNLTFVVDEEHAGKLVQRLHELLFHDRISDALLGPTWNGLFHPEGDSERIDAELWWFERREELLALAKDEPLYVYDLKTVARRAAELNSLGLDQIYFAIKANPHPEILKLALANGIGLECVSPGELEHAKSVGGNPLLFTPNFAPRTEYEFGFEKATYLTLDNLHPLLAWPEVFAGRDILLRMDPGHGRGHHKKVKTAGAQSKFGVPPEQLDTLVGLLKEHSIKVIGLHAHVGSGITYGATWAETAMFLASVADRIGGVRILNLGGGLGVPEKLGDARLDLDDVRESIANFRSVRPEFELWMEPGRYLVAEAGVLLAQVTQIKEKEGGRYFVGLNTGMNSLIRPSLYGAHHPIVNLSKIAEPSKIVADVVGPICETGDVLGHKRRLPWTEEGDVFVVATAGAYGHVMGSSYNLRSPAREVILE